jgi:cystathionine beta-lyase/cystathionine gamma-synthase
MKIRTKLCNPEIYTKFAPNTIDIGDSWLCPMQEKGKLFYRRGFSTNAEILNNILASVYEVPADNCLVFSSCIGIACVLSAIYNWTRILVVKGTHAEMSYGYAAYNGIVEIDPTFTDFNKNDLVCFDTVNLTTCEVNMYEELVNKARMAGAKICIDNTVASWYNEDCKKYAPDYIIESLSKFNNGMNNAILGWVYCKDLHDRDMLGNKYATYGFAPHPMDCFLTVCNLQTFDFRMQQIKHTSKIMDDWLITMKKTQPNIKYNSYIPSGIFMFSIPVDKCKQDLWKLNFTVIRKAITFGAGFTTIDMGEITEDESLIRISIGLEDWEDLRQDIMTLVNYLYL